MAAPWPREAACGRVRPPLAAPWPREAASGRTWRRLNRALAACGRAWPREAACGRLWPRLAGYIILYGYIIL